MEEVEEQQRGKTDYDILGECGNGKEMAERQATASVTVSQAVDLNLQVEAEDLEIASSIEGIGEGNKVIEGKEEREGEGETRKGMDTPRSERKEVKGIVRGPHGRGSKTSKKKSESRSKPKVNLMKWLGDKGEGKERKKGRDVKRKRICIKGVGVTAEGEEVDTDSVEEYEEE